MKIFSILASALFLSCTAAWAQSDATANTGGINNSIARPVTSRNELVSHDVTGFSNRYSGPGVTKQSIDRPPNVHPNLAPRPGGVITDTVRYGAVLLSPTAPASYGIGERYLTAPDPREDVPHEVGRAAHRDAGGIKLFSIEF